MKILRNTKASENWAPGSMPYFIIFVIILGFSTVVFLMIINSFLAGRIDIPKNVEERILMERFYNSPDCFAYEDEKIRTYLNTIDWNKFKSNAVIDKCLPSIGSKYSFKLELDNPEGIGRLSVTTTNWAGGADFRLEQRDVFVYYNNKIQNGRLSIFIQDA